MGLNDYKINSFSKPVSALDDTPQMSASELKEWFDSNTANELKQSVNGIIDELKDVDVSKQHTHDNKDILDKITEEPIYNAPSDGKLYARKDGAWSEFEEGIPHIYNDEVDYKYDGVFIVEGGAYFDGERFAWCETEIESKNYALLTAHHESVEEVENHYSLTYHQMLMFSDGRIYTRYINGYRVLNEESGQYEEGKLGEWTRWQPFKAQDSCKADIAQKDGMGNAITDTYATKEEFTDKYTWKMLGEATVTETNVTDAGEEGVTSIAIDCGYLGGYDELRMILQCGVNDANASLPSAQRHIAVGILNDVSEVCGQDDKLLVYNQGSTNGTLNPTHANNLIINSYFSDGILQYSEIFNTNYNSHCYKTTPSVALPSLSYKLIGSAGHAMYGHPIDLKNGNHIVVFRAGSDGFKFPAGTELKVYGR